MSTPYYGFQTFVTSAPSATSPYGRFIVGDSADDGDLDDAQHLMALAMNATDQIQWLGWRVGYLNVVEGSAGNPALGAQITNYNAWVLNGGWTFQASSVVELKGPTYMGAGATLHIGSNTFGVGKILADASGPGVGSEIKAIGGAPITVDGGFLKVLNIGELFVDSTSLVRLDRVPNISATPPFDRALTGANIIGCVAVFQTDGAGGFTAILNGYNAASVALHTTFARITFARAMPSTDYCVSGSINGVTSGAAPVAYILGATNATTTHVDIIGFRASNSPVDFGTTTDVVNIRVNIICASAVP